MSTKPSTAALRRQLDELVAKKARVLVIGLGARAWSCAVLGTITKAKENDRYEVFFRHYPRGATIVFCGSKVREVRLVTNGSSPEIYL